MPVREPPRLAWRQEPNLHPADEAAGNRACSSLHPAFTPGRLWLAAFHSAFSLDSLRGRLIPCRMEPSHELLGHTAEVRLRVRGADLGAVLTEAGRGLAAIQLGGRLPRASGEWRSLEVRAPDREALLVDWLNELVYLAEVERWVPVDFEVEEARDTVVRARGRGIRVTATPSKVKAATHHALAIRDVPEGLEAEVILDV